MNSFWACWTEVVSAQACDRIVERGLLLPSQKAVVGYNNGGNLSDARSTTVSWFDRIRDKDIADLITIYASEANREFFDFDISHGVFEMQFSIYKAEENSKFDWHQDTFFKHPRKTDRKLSFSLQLSDPRDYEGGEFEFRFPDGTVFDKKDFLPKGSVIVFPSFLEHRVTEVTRGTRYSLVSWIEGSKWR